MKRLFQFISLIMCLLNILHAETIWPVKTDEEMAEKVGILTGNHAENGLRIIESMPWIEEGNQKGKGKYIYVFYSPELPASQEFYAKTRKYLDQVNIRWIPILVNISVDGLYETRTPEALENAFKNGVIPIVQDQNYIDLVSNMTFTGFIYLRVANALSPEAKSYFPTVIYGDSKRLSIEIMPKDIEKLIHGIPVTIPNTSQTSILELAKKKFTLHEVEKNTQYYNQENKLVPYFLYPSVNGIKLGSFGPDFPPTIISGITDNGYIALDLSGRGNYIYLKYIIEKDSEI